MPDNWYGGSSLNNTGPHGLSEMLYAYTSGTGNNGSAFAGLNANTPWWNIALGVAMLAGRFLMIVPVLALAGSMVGKKTVPAGLGTFPTDGLLFVVLLTSVILIVGALTFFPALSLGPIVEAFSAHAGKLYLTLARILTSLATRNFGEFHGWSKSQIGFACSTARSCAGRHWIAWSSWRRSICTRTR